MCQEHFHNSIASPPSQNDSHLPLSHREIKIFLNRTYSYKNGSSIHIAVTVSLLPQDIFQ